ncbi:MAG: polysaccharide biosynthesis tyrosine autokinase, partial [Bacteroidales bacterium]|nr:polysaccharide biosynthesis tyrosine autokinase [Bacteroidales bacterium]
IEINDPVLLSYLEKLSDAITKRDELDFNVRSDIPISEKLDLQIQNIQNQIRIHAQKNIEVTENEIQTVNNNITKVNASINKLPVSERQIINIQRKFNINDEIYTLLLKRRTEAAITQASNKADTKMLDPARPETAQKKSPDAAGNSKKGILFGLLIPILIIVVIEFFNNKIEDKSDIESRTNIPIYGTIGRNKTKTNIPSAKFPKAPITEAFRALRTNLQFILKRKDKKIIAVTSSISGEGKSFIALNLASVIALSEKKTLLVGLDLRKSKLQKEFDYDNRFGMSTYLVDRCNYEDVIQKSSVKYLFLALSGPVPPNPAELIESERMQQFFEKAKKDFDYIIVDTPPIAVVTDALLINEIADAFLYVVRQSFSSKNVLKLLEDAKKEGNLKNLGIILNDIQIKKGYGYSHGYGYGYGYGYGQGYYGEFDIRKEETFIKKLLKFLKIKKS